jgi:hypothetical protein
MNKFIIPLMLLITSSSNAQVHRLEKIWQTDSIVAVPESVLPDSKKKTLYISLIDGAPWDADGKGGVAKISSEGKKYQGDWITGLNAPKGMGIAGDFLYVADISNVVVIRMSKGKIEQKIAIEGATGLNDITVDNAGNVYVSDSRQAKIWKIEKDVPFLYLDSVRGVNGLKAVGQDLLIGAGKNFIKADKNKKITQIVELPQGIDGIEPVGNGDYIVTAWAGYIFYVYADGKFETLLDSHNEKMNTADIGYDADKKTIYVPTFNAKRIVAYKLK